MTVTEIPLGRGSLKVIVVSDGTVRVQIHAEHMAPCFAFVDDDGDATCIGCGGRGPFMQGVAHDDEYGHDNLCVICAARAYLALKETRDIVAAERTR